MVAVSAKGWRLAASLKLLVDEFDRAYPNRAHGSDGSIASAQHHQQNPTSDHEVFDGFVHAVDIDEGIGPGAQPLMPAAESLRASRDSRIQYVIYEGRVFKSYVKDGHAAWTWLPYTGPNAHDHHMHVSIKRTAAARDDLRPWPIQEDEMSAAAEAAIARMDTVVAAMARDVQSIRAETDKFWSGQTITAIAEAVVKILPPEHGGQGLTAAAVADELAQRLAD